MKVNFPCVAAVELLALKLADGLPIADGDPNAFKYVKVKTPYGNPAGGDYYEPAPVALNSRTEPLSVVGEDNLESSSIPGTERDLDVRGDVEHIGPGAGLPNRPWAIPKLGQVQPVSDVGHRLRKREDQGQSTRDQDPNEFIAEILPFPQIPRRDNPVDEAQNDVGEPVPYTDIIPEILSSIGARDPSRTIPLGQSHDLRKKVALSNRGISFDKRKSIPTFIPDIAQNIAEGVALSDGENNFGKREYPFIGEPGTFPDISPQKRGHLGHEPAPIGEPTAIPDVVVVEGNGINDVHQRRVEPLSIVKGPAVAKSDDVADETQNLEKRYDPPGGIEGTPFIGESTDDPDRRRSLQNHDRSLHSGETTSGETEDIRRRLSSEALEAVHGGVGLDYENTALADKRNLGKRKDLFEGTPFAEEADIKKRKDLFEGTPFAEEADVKKRTDEHGPDPVFRKVARKAPTPTSQLIYETASWGDVDPREKPEPYRVTPIVAVEARETDPAF